MKKCFLLALILTMCMSIFSAGAEFITDQPGFQRYDEMVDIHIARAYSQSDKDALEEGYTLDNDFYIDWLRKTYNINIIVDWSATSGDDFNQKLGMCIATNDLPDAFVTTYNYWKEAAQNGLLMDVTDLFNDHASDKIKKAYQDGGQFAFDLCSIDGRMYGFASLAGTADGYTIMEVRKDWLDKLGLEMPETIQDVHDIAVAFRDAKLGGENTIPIAGGSSLYSNWQSSTNHFFGFDPILSALGSYPGYFLEKDGQAYYSTFTQETRDAVEMLAEWYAEGLIDTELGATHDVGAAINANEVGMFAGPWWGVGYRHADAFYNDENCNWQPFIIENEDGEWTCKQPNVHGNLYVCISAKASQETAEAIMTTLNVINRYETDLANLTKQGTSLLPLRCTFDNPTIVEQEYVELYKVISGEASAEDYKDEKFLTFLYNDAKNTEKLIQNYVPGTKLQRENFIISIEDTNWQRLYSIMINLEMTATKEVAHEPTSLIYMHNDVTSKYWDNLINNENTVLTQIIIGQADIEAFDALKEQWHNEGGQEIIDMLNEELAK